MAFMGIWPENRSLGQLSSYKVIAPVLMMFCFVCAPQSANLKFIWGNFDLVVENLSMANITITISLLKTIAFWSKALRPLMTWMANDWSTTVDKQDRKTMWDIAKISRNLTTKSTMMCHSLVVIYTTLRYLMIRHGGRQLLFRAYFPYNMTSSPSYEFTILGQLVATMYAANTYAAVDTFVAALVLHACGQLSNLYRELTDLRADGRAEFQAKLRNIVRKHEYLNRFAGRIENSFNMMLLMQMLGCSVQLCVQCFQTLLSVTGEENEYFILQFIFLLLYVACVLLQLYLYCYVGERLLVESTKIAYAAYDCRWYDLSPHEARSLMIIMCRARSPLHISAGGFCSFNRELYSEVLKRSVTYMSCLYAVKATSTE